MSVGKGKDEMPVQGSARGNTDNARGNRDNEIPAQETAIARNKASNAPDNNRLLADKVRVLFTDRHIPEVRGL